jgi:hypothetical protein
MGMGMPVDHRRFGGIVIRVIVPRGGHGTPFAYIPVVLLVQGQGIVFQVAGNVDLPDLFKNFGRNFLQPP